MVNLKQKIINCCSLIPSSLGALGSSWQLCHSICMGLISILASIGIVIGGMPLLFLNKYQIYFWTAALLLFAITLYLYLKTRTGSKNLLLLNFGILVLGIPIKNNKLLIYLSGAAAILISILLMLKDLWKKKTLPAKSAKSTSKAKRR